MTGRMIRAGNGTIVIFPNEARLKTYYDEGWKIREAPSGYFTPRIKGAISIDVEFFRRGFS
jgi:hypothetical protein